jgi:alkylhydroperoxidase/carboxymuconolactone decarboxylase family protein YurZ
MRALIKECSPAAARPRGCAFTRAVAKGVQPDELGRVMFLAIPARGLPAAVEALTWMDYIIGDQ